MSTEGRRTRRTVLAACAPAIVAGACRPGGETAQPGGAAKRVQTGLLQLWGSYGAMERDVLLKYLNQFAALHPGTTVELQIYTNQDFMTKLIAALAGGTGPDFVRFKEYQALDMAALGYAVELDGLVSKDKRIRLDDFTTQSVEGSRYKNKLAGIPHHHQFVMMGWNKTLFQQAGLNPDKGPETWDELRDFARRLRKPENDVWGFRLYEIAGKPREQQFNWFMEFVWRNGGDVFNKDRTQVLLDRPESIEAMQFMVDLMYRDKSTPTPADPIPDANKGKVAIWMPTGAGFLNVRQTAPDLVWGIGPMPRKKQFATQAQHNTFSMLKVSKLQDLTWEAIIYLASDEVASKWQPEVATIPVRKSVYEKPPYSNDPGWKQIIDILRMPGNRPKPHVPNWDEFTEETICPYLLEAWAQQKSPKDALMEATRQGNAWLAKNLRRA
jgi:ABC-type glycerol-3-phosphate transport system substrate-binding protein